MIRPKPYRDPRLDGKPPPGPQHVFGPYATRCDRCGLQLIYAGQPDTPPCVSDEAIAARRAFNILLRQRGIRT